MRTSEILRGILTKNPGVQQFSIARILTSIGSDRTDASLVMLSMPAMIPVPAPNGVIAGPASVIACQMMAGEKQLTLPRAMLRKFVSRRSLAVAIHAILPLLEAAERVMKPRFRWMSHPHARRAIGLLIFLLAIAIAYPLSGFNVLHALSIFIVSLGLAEQDGLAVLIGIVAGVVSLAILATSSVSAKAIRTKLMKALRKLGVKLGRTAVTEFLERIGYTQIALALRFEWSELLLIWDPETSEARSRHSDRADDVASRALFLGAGRETIDVPGVPCVDQPSAGVG